MKTNIEFVGGKKFKARIRDHEIVIDLPQEQGGGDAGLTPPELFIASLGSCMGYFAMGYLRTAKLDPKGISIDLDWDFDDKKTRIGKIDISVTVRGADLGDRKKGLISAMETCIVHNTLRDNPEMKVSISEKD